MIILSLINLSTDLAIRLFFRTRKYVRVFYLRTQLITFLGVVCVHKVFLIFIYKTEQMVIVLFSSHLQIDADTHNPILAKPL